LGLSPRTSRRIKLKSLRWLLAIVLLVSAGDGFGAGEKPPKTAKEKIPAGPLPSFDLVTRQVKQILALDPEYQEGDLLTAPKVERILAKLEQIKWKVADRGEIIKLLLSDSDWMAVRLLTPLGKHFMRRIATMPGGYDRVDRLRNMPDGEYQVSDFIESPGGYTMIEYMTTTQEGKNLGELVSEGVNGENFNKPTGRIYTERELLKRLRISYDAEDARRHGLDPKPPTKSGKSASKSKSSSKFPSKANRPRRVPAPEPPDEEPAMPPVSIDGPPQ
jgi:hypothetical protein